MTPREVLSLSSSVSDSAGAATSCFALISAASCAAFPRWVLCSFESWRYCPPVLGPFFATTYSLFQNLLLLPATEAALTCDSSESREPETLLFFSSVTEPVPADRSGLVMAFVLSIVLSPVRGARALSLYSRDREVERTCSLITDFSVV